MIKLTHHQIIKSTSLRRTLVLTVLYSAKASLQCGSVQRSQVLGAARSRLLCFSTRVRRNRDAMKN